MKIIQEMPYYERQLIIVEDDAIIEAQRTANIEAQKDKTIDYPKLLIDVFLRINPINYAFVEGIKFVAKAISDLKTEGVNVLPISRTEAKDLIFPPGHTRNKVLYVGHPHPAASSVYYTVAEFHRKTFEHKFAEAIRLLMSLGAKEIEVEHVSGWSKDFAAKISAGIGKSPNLEAEAGVSGQSKSKLLFKANLKENQSMCLPENLIWYYHEPSWQQIGEGRLKYGLTDFSLLVHYEDDFGVNTELKVSAQKAGFDLGGNFEKHSSTVWSLMGKF